MPHPRIYDKARLDVLIYAQDGRGVGHVSRSAAIAMALRRLFPQLKVLLLSGYRETQMLLGESPVDWIKLPAYETQIVEGKAKGKLGDTNLKNCYLGPAREFLIESVVREFKPRCVLVDHLPGGRKNELELAQLLSHNTSTQWILGVRGIPGNDASLWADKSSQIFHKIYTALLWYGDPAVLGNTYLVSLQDHFGMKPFVAGYVSRYTEINHWQQDGASAISGILSLPWLTENSLQLLEEFYRALENIGDSWGKWVIYTKLADLGSRARKLQHKIEALPFCSFRQISNHYFNDLRKAKILIAYGGYNSLSDILAANIPAIVITRKLHDKEQDDHVTQLRQNAGSLIHPVAEEKVDATLLEKAIRAQSLREKAKDNSIDLGGADKAARYIAALLQQQE